MLRVLKVYLGEVFRPGGSVVKMKLAFATCVQLGLSCIEEIYRIDGNLDLLITLKDEKAKNKSGRIFLDDIALKNIPLL